MNNRTASQIAADAVTEFSGSWPFIIWFTLFCGVWILWNLFFTRFDPYPFLFLNWVLTIVSTFQSPLIMMSNNRQNEMDREYVQDILARLDTIENLLKELK